MTGFSQMETCLRLSLVKGSRFHPPQRSRSLIPASCAIRSSSAGHTYRKGIERRSSFPSTILEVMGGKGLRRDVVLVEAPSRLAHVEGPDRFAGREPLELGDAYLDDEAAARLDVRRDVAEAGDLLCLRRQVHDGVEDQVGDGERSVHGRRREVADRDADFFATCLRPQPRDHRLRQLDPVHRHSSLRERERDAARPDPQFQRAPGAGELGEDLDGRVDERRVEHLRLGFVVPRGDALVEVAVVVNH
jgi:hypothetical protein